MGATTRSYTHTTVITITTTIAVYHTIYCAPSSSDNENDTKIKYNEFVW